MFMKRKQRIWKTKDFSFMKDKGFPFHEEKTKEVDIKEV